MNTIHKQFPFDPARWPFYYGWMILGFGTLGILMSIPGQTVGVSVFTDYLIGSLGISRNLLSLAYLIGTVTSALLLTRAGRFYDRYGARTMSVIVSISLGCVLLFFSFSDVITDGLRRSFPWLEGVAVPFILMSIGFFLLRFTGQGSLTLVSRNVVMEWFEKRRGLANGALGVAVSFGFSYAPFVLNALIQAGDWRWAWRILALIVGVGFAALAFLFFRDKPEDHNLIPDGSSFVPSKKVHQETTAVKDFTLPEARRTFTFWIFTLALTVSAFLVTALTFHVISVFESSGLTRTDAVSIFFPASLVAVSFQFLGSFLSDYIKLKFILTAQIIGMVLLSLGIIFLSSGMPVILIIAGLGINQGLFGVTGNITWARFFGRKHLGAISGFNMAWMVAGSAIGPYAFSLSLDQSGSYRFAAVCTLIILVVLLAGTWKADQPAGAVHKAS